MNRQRGQNDSDSVKEAGGFDTLHLGLYGEWDQDAFAELTAEWDACKQAAEDQDNEGAIWQTPGGDIWQLWSHGSKHGGGCRWVADWAGCTLFIANQHEAITGRNSLFVQMHSLALMARGVDDLWNELRRMLAGIGFRLLGHKVSRIDVCVDLPGVDVKEFTALAMAGHEISKAKQGAIRFGATAEDHQTYERGNRERVFLRMYDKLKETEYDPAKRAILEAKRWGGEVEKATRVEFQIGREVLKVRWVIDTLDDLRERLPQLSTWLTAEWYRLAECVVDRKNRNHDRAATANLWERVQQAFASWVGANTIPTVEPRKVLRPKVDQLFKQARGCLVAAFAFGERVFADSVELGEVAMQMMGIESERMFEALGIKRQELGIKLGPAVAAAGDTPF